MRRLPRRASEAGERQQPALTALGNSSNMKVTVSIAAVPDERDEPCGRPIFQRSNFGLVRRAEFFCFLKEKDVA
jgi:hypothetical protein